MLIQDHTTERKVFSFKVYYGEDQKQQGFYWPASDQKRSDVMQVRRGSPEVFEATYQCRPGKREGSIFLDADLKAFFVCTNGDIPFSPTDLTMGLSSLQAKAFMQKGHSIEQAWDTAFSTSIQSAHTVCVTGMLVPCQSYHCGEDEALLGPCEFHFDVLILDVFRKRLDWGGLTNSLKEKYQTFKPMEVLIEKKASGISLIQAMENSGIPIIGVGATVSKGARAVNTVTLKSAGSVQGWFRQHRVLTPQYAPWLDAWRAEMKDFSGSDDASSDQVDATVHLVTRAIVMGSGMIALPTDWTPERAALPGHLDTASWNLPTPSNDPRAMILSSIGDLPNLTIDPFDGTCSRCIHHGDVFCAIQGRRMLAVDSCDSFSSSPDFDFNAASLGLRL